MVTGPKGCKIPTKSFSLLNIMAAEAIECKATWKNAANCPAQDCSADGKIAPNAQAKVSYIAEPPLLACGKLVSLTVKRAGTPALVCTGLTDVASPAGLYYIKENADKSKCEVSNSPVRGRTY